MTNKTSDNSNFNKVNTATVIAVLAMHIGIAMALTHMHVPKKVVEKPEEVKPVEIQLLSLQEGAEPMPIEFEQSTSEQSMPTAENPETSVDQPQNQPKPKKTEPQAKSEPQVEPELVEETEAVNESEPELEQQTEPETDLEADPKLETELDTDLEIVTKVKITPIIDTNEHHRLIEQKGPEQKGLEQKGPEQKGQEQKGPEQKGPGQAPANDTPKSFSVSQARWKRKPDFKLPMREDRRVSLGETFSVTLELIVDKQGNVTKATVIKSSDNRAVDDATVKAVKKSKLHPFTENNLPVVGKVVLPVDYEKK
ncbi:TonB family protein [Psychrobacter phenylpyruvicus]|uniref:TonB family protein n=1 Tax=Psychrobacter phenylpyruvicus TaxID=29432 RepID=UPI0012DEAF13|nr:energy transducer TonB [Psychrobacter phenylpyruvicus]